MSQLINKEIFDILLPLCDCDKSELIKFNIQWIFFNNSDYYSIDVLLPYYEAPKIPYEYRECANDDYKVCDDKHYIVVTFSCLSEYITDFKHICDGKYSKVGDKASNTILSSCVANRTFWSNIFKKDVNSIMNKIKAESSIKSTEVLKDLAEVYYESNLELYKPLNELRYEFK